MFGEAFKNFKINFNALNEKGTFSSGDPITGQISFELTKMTKITSITLTLVGKAKVHWAVRRGGRKQRRTQHFRAKLEFFNVQIVILRENGAIHAPVKLRPGRHVYQFTCQIPHGDFPTSFQGVHGRVMYSLVVCIDRPWHLTKNFETALNFVCRHAVNAELLAPLEGSNSMSTCSLWCASGFIKMNVKTQKKLFNPGDTVKVMCWFSNTSSWTATPKVRLIQKQVVYTENKVHKREISNIMVSQTGQPVTSHTSDVYCEIMVTIPPTAPFTISNCSILEVDYIIKLYRSYTVTGEMDMNMLLGHEMLQCDFFSSPRGAVPHTRRDSQTVARGCHVYPFTFQIPAHNLPPSFKGTAGKIQYTLEAILCRPMRPNSKAKAPFTLISKTNVNSSSELWEQTPQHDIKEKKMNFFTSGSVSMDVHIDRTAFYQGEGIKVMASILNSSSREIRPKYCVYRKHSFFAENKRKVNTEDLIKEVGEPIPPSSSQTVTRIITIPPSLGVSILNCKLIKAEYRLRVYLDVKYARDPVIKFPIVILPAPQEPDVEQRPAYGGFGFEAFGNPSQ
ncbi:arrestin domain-containing protein 3-like [Lampris incognitus]|uniref:arrestin domain-containing protein 3-like n=1 Tax=Lampris incognitus TaxID=2546036 RepID=UPI0024B631AD|nr:arrestin domain-containing protein 3-like [Lampris incognitus]